MLTSLLLLLGLAGAQAGWCAPAGPPQPDAHTLLLAHLDTSCNAALAKGSPAAWCSGRTRPSPKSCGGRRPRGGS